MYITMSKRHISQGEKCKFPNFKDGIFFNNTSNHCATERKNKYFLNR